MRNLQSEHPRPLTLLAVGAGGRIAAAGYAFGVTTPLELWDATTGASLPSPRASDHLNALAFTADGTRLAFSTGGIFTFGHTHIKYRLQTTTFALHPDGERVVIAANGRQSAVECWRVRSAGSYTQVWSERLGEFHRCGSPTITPTGERTAAAEGYDGPDGRPRQEVAIRDTETGKTTARISLHAAAPALQLAFTADGAKLLVRDDSRTVQVFDAASGTRAGELVHRGRPFVTAVAVHPRGPVACARTDGTVTFWDADRREPIRTLDWKAGKLVSLAFSPDGTLAAAGTEDGKVVVWDVDV